MDDDYSQAKMWIAKTLETLTSQAEAQQKEINRLSTELEVVKVKVALYSAAAATVVTIAVEYILKT